MIKPEDDVIMPVILPRARAKLTFKCTDSKKLVEEMWFFVDEMLVVTFALPNGSQRLVQYLPRIKRDQG